MKIASIIFGLILTFLLVALLMGQPGFEHIGAEDNLIENIGALAFLGSAIAFAWIGWKSRPEKLRVLIFVGLAGLFLFIAGEEISWGQRIFGWETPAWMKEHNIQGETSIHNLAVFNVYGETEIRPFWERLFSMNRMFSMFWLAWCFMLPIAVALSGSCRKLATYLKIPVPSVVFGVAFLTIYISAKLFIRVYQPGEIHNAQIDELKECFYALIFFGVASHFWIRLKQLKSSPQPWRCPRPTASSC